ncbi:MAG TPA: LysR substrate-binding domain-containing protein, partial [Gemmatimonadaceae bacterium]|nr:LysR substrate-binding domain-containing protein [Gemmatimonadaceae bacterium]
ISKSLNELERQLGLTLLDRGGRSIRLTDAGQTLYARARELFGVERIAEQELREIRGLKRGVLRIGASTTIATYMLPPYLGRFHLRHPGIRIRATSANTRTVLRMLLESRVDVALVEGPVSHPQVEIQPWREDELVVISHPEHRLLYSTGVDVAMLVREQFIVREPGSGTRDVIARALALHGARLAKTMRVGGTEAIKQAVAAGLGLAIVSRAAAADQLALGRIAVLSVEGLVMRRTLGQIKLRGRVPTAAARELELLLAHGEADGNAGDASGTPD